MAVNPTIEAILAKLDDVIAAQPDNTAIVDAITAQTTVLGDISTTLANIYEKVNSTEFNVANIWERVNLLDTEGIYNELVSLRSLFENVLGPFEEAQLFAQREMIAAIRVLSCMCEVNANPFGPPPALSPPTDESEHCRRAHYFFGRTILRINEVLRNIRQGVQLGNDAIAYLFGFNVVVGIDDTIVSPDIRLGLAGLLAQGASIILEDAKDWIAARTDALSDIMFNSASALEGKQNLDAYIDSQLPGLANIILNQVLKLLFNQGSINILYDQSHVWDTSDYAAVTCVSGGTYNELFSVDTVIITFTGPTGGMVAFDNAKHRLFTNPLPDAEHHYTSAFVGHEVWSIASEDYVYDEGLTGKQAWAVFTIANLHNYRIRVASGAMPLTIMRDMEEYATLSLAWWRFPDEEAAWAVFNDVDNNPFVLHVQQLINGVWQDPF